MFGIERGILVTSEVLASKNEGNFFLLRRPFLPVVVKRGHQVTNIEKGFLSRSNLQPERFVLGYLHRIRRVPGRGSAQFTL